MVIASPTSCTFLSIKLKAMFQLPWLPEGVFYEAAIRKVIAVLPFTDSPLTDKKSLAHLGNVSTAEYLLQFGNKGRQVWLNTEVTSLHFVQILVINTIDPCFRQVSLSLWLLQLALLRWSLRIRNLFLCQITPVCTFLWHWPKWWTLLGEFNVM